jgi:hypothetical protein
VINYGISAVEINSNGLFETGITADAIQEPLKYCIYGESAPAVKAELMRLDFDIAGIRASKDQPTLEFIRTASLRDGNCEEGAEPIKAMDIISESTPLIDILSGLKERAYFFIQNGMQISGIIARADLQKPPIRILIFGMISLLEMHLTYLVRVASKPLVGFVLQPHFGTKPFSRSVIGPACNARPMP